MAPSPAHGQSLQIFDVPDAGVSIASFVVARLKGTACLLGDCAMVPAGS